MNPPRTTPPTITLYTKPACHLCEAVHQVIEAVRQSRAFHLDIRNILDDPYDFERYQHAIPVVLLDGVEIARYRLTAAELQAHLSPTR
jgi:hypothetical protein